MKARVIIKLAAARGARVLIGLVSACLPFSAVAGEWRFVPHLSLTEEYTDNITLADRNTLDDFITSINSGLSVRGNSARLNSNIDYNLQEQIYAQEDNFSGSSHQLQANTDLLVVEHWLNFLVKSSVSQQARNNSRRFNRSNRSQTGNSSTVVFREYKPTLNHRFGKWVDLNGAYSISETETSRPSSGSGNTGGADDEIISLSLSSGRVLSRTPMSISFQRSEENFDSGRTNMQKRYNFSISYIFDRKLRANFSLGKSDHSGRNTDNSGMTWNAGSTWTPSPRTNLTVGYGSQTFGNSFNFTADHRHRRWNFNARYSEQIRTRSQELRDLVLIPLDDGFGNPIFDANNAIGINNPDNLPSINEESNIRKTFALKVNYRGKRTVASVGLNNNERTGQSGNSGDETVTTLNASIRHSLSRRASIGLSSNLRKTTSSGTRGDNERTFEISPFVQYILGPHTDLRFNYSYGAGSGENSSEDAYVENSVTATVSLHY